MSVCYSGVAAPARPVGVDAMGELLLAGAIGVHDAHLEAAFSWADVLRVDDVFAVGEEGIGQGVDAGFGLMRELGEVAAVRLDRVDVEAVPGFSAWGLLITIRDPSGTSRAWRRRRGSMV